MADATTPASSGDLEAQGHTPAALMQCGLESLIHNYNQYGAMLRAQMANASGLDPEQYGRPFPGHSNVRITNGLRGGGLALIIAAIVAAAAAGLFLPKLFEARRAIETKIESAAEGNSDAIRFDPNEYEFRIVPTEDE